MQYNITLLFALSTRIKTYASHQSNMGTKLHMALNHVEMPQVPSMQQCKES